MAPAPKFPGLTAEVIVDGRALTEHDHNEYAHPNTKTVYVQSEAGEHFGVRYFIPGHVFEQYDIKAIVSIDGTAMRKFIHEKYVNEQYGVSRFAYASSARFGNRDLGQRFRFASLDTHDEAVVVGTHLQKQLAFTGDISVAFHRVTNVRMSSGSKDAPTIFEYDKVPEKALKGSAVSHKTRNILEPMERIAPVKWMEADYVDGEKYPFAVIQFKYRSAAALRSLFIIPRKPSPLPLEQRPTNQLSRDEMSLLLNTRRAKDEDTPNLKRERTYDRYEDGEIKVVEERSAKRRCLPTRNDLVIVLD